MDTRVLTAHLTLGRISSNHGLNRLLRLLSRHEFDPLGTLEVSMVTFFQSTLELVGPVYTRLHTAALAAPAPAQNPPGEEASGLA